MYLICMLIEQRRPLRLTPGRTGQDKRPSRIVEWSGLRVIDTIPDASDLEVAILHHIRHRVHRAGQ